MINEQSQRKSELSSMGRMRKQFSEECADSFIFNNISLFLVFLYNLISILTAGEFEHLKGDELNIEICRSHTKEKVHSGSCLHFLAVLLTISVN